MYVTYQISLEQTRTIAFKEAYFKCNKLIELAMNPPKLASELGLVSPIKLFDYHTGVYFNTNTESINIKSTDEDYFIISANQETYKKLYMHDSQFCGLVIVLLEIFSKAKCVNVILNTPMFKKTSYYYKIYSKLINL